MAKDKQGKNALAQALAMRDQSTMAMVEAAVRHGDVMLAFQPVVQAQRPDRMAFYEGLIRVLDETGRIIPAKEFIDVIEETEIGRIVDCLALEKGMRTLLAKFFNCWPVGQLLAKTARDWHRPVTEKSASSRGNLVGKLPNWPVIEINCQ